jgi:nucleoside triphosphate diphosphatase
MDRAIGPLLLELEQRLRIGPADGVQIVSAGALVRRPFDPGMALLIVPVPGTRATAPHQTLPGRHGHPDEAGTEPEHGARDLLRRLYPAAHPVLGLGGGDDASIGTLSADALRTHAHAVPSLDPLENGASPYGLPWLVARLRAPGGCPWDQAQDHRSLRPHLLEEAYEVYDALEGGSTPALAEELGDLLLQIVLHAQYGAEAGVFDMADVQRGIVAKIVRRHPHVFGDVTAGSVDEVVRNWERIKADERAAVHRPGAPDGEASSPAERGDPDMPAAFAGLSRSLPALSYAAEMQARAAGLGYDWPDLEGVIDKVAEEATELLAASGADETAEEYGDLLFVLVNLGRKMGVDPEAALRAASRKFAGRFARVERLAEARKVELRALGLDALDDLWQEAKREEAWEASEAGGPRVAEASAAPAPSATAALGAQS